MKSRLPPPLALVEKGNLKLDEDVNAELQPWKVPENEFTKSEKMALRRPFRRSAAPNEGGARTFAVDEQPFGALQTLGLCTWRGHDPTWNVPTTERSLAADELPT